MQFDSQHREGSASGILWPRPRQHDGGVAAIRSNVRWCSEALEFTCWNSGIVKVAFALDCHDREVIGWTATTGGISAK